MIYANLPGIATDQPDVYETGSDLPEADQQPYQRSRGIPVEKDSTVETIDVAPVDAYKRFESATLSSKNVDFRDSFPNVQRGYQTWGDWELAARGSKDEETPLQKYHRLQAEFQELQESLKPLINKDLSKTENSLTGDLTLGKMIGSLDQLSSQLNSLNVNEYLESDILSRPESVTFANIQKEVEKMSQEDPVASDKKTPPKSLPQPVVTYELMCRPETSRSSNVMLYKKLEQKLSNLEKLVGVEKSSCLTSITNDMTVCEAVRVLTKRVSQLDSNQLEQVDGRLTSLISKLNSVTEKKTQLDQMENESRLIHLMELIKSTEDQRAAIPAIAARLNSLAAIEQQGIITIPTFYHLIPVNDAECHHAAICPFFILFMSDM